MKSFLKIILLIGAGAFQSSAFMTNSEFKLTTLTDCYATKRENQVNPQLINGQELPLPSSLETFISLVERYEIKYSTKNPEETILDFLTAFKCDDITGSPPKVMKTRSVSADVAKLTRYLAGVSGLPRPASTDFTLNEQCALHFMLSHTINDTLKGDINEERETGGQKDLSKRPRESGVVSLHSKTKHAFALGKVLLGILMGLRGEPSKDASEIVRFFGKEQHEELNAMKINSLAAVTISDVISVSIKDAEDKNVLSCLAGNGLWNDALCTTEYSLNVYSNCYVTSSYIRGAMDGFILGKSIKKQADLNTKLKLSQILRTYYGPYGFPTDTDFTWCQRRKNFMNLRSELLDEVFNYDRVFKHISDTTWDEIELRNTISTTFSTLDSSDDAIFKEAGDEASFECSSMDSTGSRACETPSDIFSILDYSSTEILRDFQHQVIGNLSVGFDMRPSWSSMGVYNNQKPQQGSLLDSIVNNTGISGCPSCFAKYYSLRGSKESEVEVFTDLNSTIAAFIENQTLAENSLNQDAAGTNAKVILYFNYGSPRPDWDLKNSVWEIRKNYREATVIAVGSKKESLEVFTTNTYRDIFTDTGDAGNLANKLRERICKVPAEFQYKDCQQSSRGSGNARYDGYITQNKIQYWAMYPKYFLKSFGIKLKFKAVDGSQIRVCFSREYSKIIEDKGSNAYCKDSVSGDDQDFYVSNPCYRRHEGNCDPFYFSIEGKKATTTASCGEIRCKSTNQIRFEFSHEGIACSTGSYSSISLFTLLMGLLITFCSILLHNY